MNNSGFTPKSPFSNQEPFLLKSQDNVKQDEIIDDDHDSLALSSEDSELSNNSSQILPKSTKSKENSQNLHNLESLEQQTLKDFQKHQRLLNIREVFNEMFNQEIDCPSSQPDNDTLLLEEYLDLYKKTDKNNQYFLHLIENYSLESVFFQYRRRRRKNRKKLYKFKLYFFFMKDLIGFYCYQLINCFCFKYVIAFLILLNLFFYIYNILNSKSMVNFYLIITPLYLIELFIRFFGYGPKKFWLNPWNILDSFVISGCLLNILVDNPLASFCEMPLRIFRVPKLLNLRTTYNILEGILSSMKVLGETMWFLWLFCAFYALSGLHLFSGILKQRCLNKFTGLISQDFIYCGNLKCPNDYLCIKLLDNPDNNSTNFDNFLSAIIQVLRVITFDNWTDVMNLTQRTLTNYTSIYFISLALLGNFFLLNFFLAVLKVRFDNFRKKLERNTMENKNFRCYDIRKLKEMGVYHKKNTNYSPRRVSVGSICEFEKTILNFIKRKVYNFDEMNKTWEDQDLRKNLRNKLFIVEIKKDLKFRSESKKDVLPERKKLKFSQELINVKNHNKRTYLKSSFLSNINIFKENFRQMQKKLFGKSNFSKNYLRKSTQNLRNLQHLFIEYENIEKMRPQNPHIKQSPTNLFALNKQNSSFYKSNPLMKRLKSNNDSISISTLSMNQIYPFTANKTITIHKTKNDVDLMPISTNNLHQSESNLLNVMLENRNRSKSSPNRRIHLEKKLTSQKILNKLSNVSIETPNNSSINRDNSINANININATIGIVNNNHSFFSKKESVVTFKRRNSFIVSETINSKKIQSDPNEIMENSIFFKKKNKLPIFWSNLLKKSKKFSLFHRQLSKTHRFGFENNEKIAVKSEDRPKKLNDYLEWLKKKNFGFQKELEKKYGITLKYGVNLTYEQAKTIVNDSSDLIKEKRESDFKDNEKNYLKILKKDTQSNKLTGNVWSGTDLEIFIKHEKLKKILLSLTNFDIEIWMKGFKGKLINLRRSIKILIKSPIFNFITIFSILSYSILLCLEGFLSDEDWAFMNIFFIGFFTFETTVKLFVYGIQDYLRDSLNFIDFCCQICYIIDLLDIYILQVNNFEEIYVFSIFRGIYPLKMLRLMLYSNYIRVIGNIIKETLRSFIAISIFLTFLILIYALWGMQLFSQNFVDSYGTQMNNFHDITSSIGTVFNIINFVWYSCFSVLFATNTNFYTLSFYNITLIFFGHFIVLNLFIALMLRGFEASEDDIENNEENLIKTKSNSKNDSNCDSLENEDSFENNGKIKDIKTSSSEESEDDVSSKETEAFNEKNGGFIQFNQAFFLLGKNSRMRKIIGSLLKRKDYKRLVKFMIILTIFSLALETYDEMNSAGIALKFVLNFFFLGDLMLNSIYYGLFIGKKTFWRNMMQVVEIFIIVGFIVEILIDHSNKYFIIKAIGMLRLIRTLRIFNEIKGMGLVVNSIIFSISGLIKVLFIVLMVWLMFSISGMKLFRNKFGYCDTPDQFGISISQCLPPQQWKTYPFNFDNAINGLLVLFIIGTFDDEVGNIIHIAINSDFNNVGPLPYSNQFLAFFFLGSFMVIGVWFFLNLFIGVVFMNFNIIQKSSKNPDLTENQIQWIEMEKVIAKVDPYRYNQSHLNFMRRMADKLLRSEIHRWLIGLASCILFIVLILNNDPPIIKDYEKFLDILTLVLTVIYIYEIMLKFIFYGFLGYFEEKSHFIQFLLTLIYVFSSVLIIFSSNDKKSIDARLLSLFSFFKIFGLFRVLERLKGLKRLFITLRFNSSNIKNILYHFMLTLTIYTVIGCYLFKDVKTGKIINDYVNFKDFLYGMMTLIRCFTANSWPNIMMDTMKLAPYCTEGLDCGSSFSPIFFISFLFIFQMILSNLLILVLLEEFQYFSKNPKNPVLIFHENLGTFKKVWANYVEKQKLHISKLIEFLRLLGPPLGIKKNDGFSTVGLKIKKMTIITNSKGFINFHNLLHSVMKTHILDELYQLNGQKINEKAKKELAKRERKFYKSVKKRLEKNNLISFTFHQNTNVEPQTDVKNYPFRNYFYSNLMFSLWMKFAERNQNSKRQSNIGIVAKNNENEAKSQILMPEIKTNFIKEKFFKLNNIEIHEPKKSLQSVIMEEEENEEKKSIEKIDKIVKGKRMTNKVTPKMVKKKISC